MVEDTVLTRQKRGIDSILRYQHPSELEQSPFLPQNVKQSLDDGNVLINML